MNDSITTAGLAEATILALALAMDATAVATARSVAGLHRGEAVRLAASFGGFQAAMAAAGWAIGASAARWVAAWDHWIAFALLAAVGGKMIVEAARRGPEAPRPASPLTGRVIVLLSVATSIDALAAGITLPALEAPEVVSVATIGVACFALTFAGAITGRRVGLRGGRFLEAIGGATLIGIGTRILFEHLGRGT